MAKLNYKIIIEVGILSINENTGLQKEVNLISWDNGDPVIDIREWSNDRKKIGKGITLDGSAYSAIKQFFQYASKSSSDMEKIMAQDQGALVSRAYTLREKQIRAISLMAAYENREKGEIVRSALNQYIPVKYFDCPK